LTNQTAGGESAVRSNRLIYGGNDMNTFEIGKEYFARSICDSDCIFTVKIVKRTAKTVTFLRNGKEQRTKLFTDDHGEYIAPYHYSMAPIFRAEHEVQPEDSPAAEESAAVPAAEDAAPCKVVTISQPADNGTIIVMIGQRVECVCGACYPVQGGTIVGFYDKPAGRFTRGGVYALIRWDDRPDRPERVRLSDIHRRGWRSANGSPLGVFVC